MSNLLVYVDRSTVREGKLDELEAEMSDLVEFVEANEPEILAYHMEVAGPEFPTVGPFIDLESIDVYGNPSEDAVERLREKASTLGSGRVIVHDLHDGFDRISGG